MAGGRFFESTHVHPPTAGSPALRGMPAPPPLALSPRGAGVRKRRGGPVSPGRGASRASLDTTVRTEAMLTALDSVLQCPIGGFRSYQALYSLLDVMFAHQTCTAAV